MSNQRIIACWDIRTLSSFGGRKPAVSEIDALFRERKFSQEIWEIDDIRSIYRLPLRKDEASQCGTFKNPQCSTRDMSLLHVKIYQDSEQNASTYSVFHISLHLINILFQPE